MTFLTQKTLHIDAPINIKDTLFSGQTFSWTNASNNHNYFVSIIENDPLIISQKSEHEIDVFSISNRINGQEVGDVVANYFSVDIDHDLVFSERFRKNYPQIRELAERHIGVRLLRQDPFETMATFMCAQGIGMHLIRRQVEMIAERFGSRATVNTGSGYVTIRRFPAAETLASANPEVLAECTNNNRTRAANIIRMSRAYLSGALPKSRREAQDIPLETLRAALCSQHGIGMKIADCIALFGFGKLDAFPIDTHVRQYLQEWFGIGVKSSGLTEKQYRTLQEAAVEFLGRPYAGVAGHILFHCWRKEVRKMKRF